MAEAQYHPLLAEEHISARSLCASGVFHLMIVLTAISWRFIGPLEQLPDKPRNYEVRIIQYRLPDSLLFAKANRGAGARRARDGGGGERGGSGGDRAGSGGARARAKPRFQVPMPVKQPARPRDVVIQPEFSEKLVVAGKIDLPNLMLWTPREIPLPARHLKTFVPGETKRTPPKPRALPDAPSSLELPNKEIRVNDLKFAAITGPSRPALPVFRATTSPVRIRRKELEAPSELPVAALPAGQPVSLLAMMQQPAPPAANFAVPGGNQLGVTGADAGADLAADNAGSGAQAGTGKGPGNNAGAGTGAGSGKGAGGAAGTGGAGTGSGAGSGTGAGAGGAGAGSGRGTGSGVGTGSGSGTGSGTGSGPGSGKGTGAGAGSAGWGSGSGAGGAGAGISGVRLGANSVPIQTEAPNTSLFDIVVVNQGVTDVLPEASGVLTGQPVHTVYLTVPGSGSEWILQYAVPRSREPVQVSGNSVRLGAVTPVRPPYPLRKTPLALDGRTGLPSRVVVYASISQKGLLEDLRMIRGAGSEVDSLVLDCLHHFLFRPAVRDGVPVLVEALFGIPLH